MLPLTLFPPAKINLSLRVLGRRDDGFHALDTLMVPLRLADVLNFSPAEDFRFTCDAPGVPVDETNLVVRAVRIFERETGRKVHLHIHLSKNIPHGAGLGGGSSDAAFALKGLDVLYETSLGRERLASLASELGSDVPFFLYETLCRCTGRGERIEPLHQELKAPVLLIKPPFGVSTPEAYKKWGASGELRDVQYAEQKWREFEISNDLERPVFEKYIFLSTLKMWLLEQEESDVALMSGSGSTLFVLCHSSENCEKLAQKLEKRERDLWMWKGVTY